MAGNPSARGQRGQEIAQCACLRNGPYFAPDPHNWAGDFNAGGANGCVTPQIRHPMREVALELKHAMRTAWRLWFLLGRPQYAEREDLDLFLDPEPVYYARHGRGYGLETNAAKSFHMENRNGGDAYRSRLREGDVPRVAETGRCSRQADECDMMYGKLREEIWGENAREPCRAPGRKPYWGFPQRRREV